MRWLWIGGAVLMAVAAIAVWQAFQSPEFVAGLTALAAGAVWKAVAPEITKRMDPETEERMRECIRSGGKWDNFRKRCK